MTNSKTLKEFEDGVEYDLLGGERKKASLNPGQAAQRQRKVFRLVGKLLYEGPGTVPLSPVNEGRIKGRRPQGQTR